METRAHVSLFSVGLLCLQFLFVTSQNPVVRTSLGNVRGRIEEFPDGQVLQFLGVPYAEPPIGNLRFKKPVSSGAWTGELDATRYGPSCLQKFPYNNLAELPNRNANEDCLLLNIYKPISTDTNINKAVMVYIHGGGFNSGQGMATDGSLLALRGDIIVVTINYRLDIFGFLCTGNCTSRGNYGLWDQHKALEWIQIHINTFGGDPNRVTIFGASAGAFSIGMHLFSTHSVGLFQRAILQSGSPFSKLALAFNPGKYAQNVNRHLQCTDSVQCLNTKSITEILDASVAARTHKRLAYRLEIAPVIDGDFLQKHPYDLLMKGGEDIPFYTTDIMTGTNTAEGGNVLYMINSLNEDLNIDARVAVPRNVMCDNVTHYLVKDFYNGDNDVTEKICNIYDKVGLTRDGQSMKVVNLVGDMMFVAPAVQTLELHTQYAKNKAHYQYVFSYEPRFSTIKQYFPWFKGANHLDDLPFVFGPEVSYSSSTVIVPDEIVLSKEIMRYWSNFAKTGNPNGRMGASVYWPAFTSSEREYINLNILSTKGRNIWRKRMTFWNSQLPSYLHKSDVSVNDNTNNGTVYNTCDISILCTITFIVIFVLIGSKASV